MLYVEQNIHSFMISEGEAVKKWIFLIMLEHQSLVIMLHAKKFVKLT